MRAALALLALVLLAPSAARGGQAFSDPFDGSGYLGPPWWNPSTGNTNSTITQQSGALITKAGGVYAWPQYPDHTAPDRWGVESVEAEIAFHDVFGVPGPGGQGRIPAGNGIGFFFYPESDLNKLDVFAIGVLFRAQAKPGAGGLITYGEAGPDIYGTQGDINDDASYTDMEEEWTDVPEIQWDTPVRVRVEFGAPATPRIPTNPLWTGPWREMKIFVNGRLVGTVPVTTRTRSVGPSTYGWGYFLSPWETLGECCQNSLAQPVWVAGSFSPSQWPAPGDLLGPPSEMKWIWAASDAGPAFMPDATVSGAITGKRAEGRLLSVSSSTVTVGEVSYPTSTTFSIPVTGTGSVTITDAVYGGSRSVAVGEVRQVKDRAGNAGVFRDRAGHSGTFKLR